MARNRLRMTRSRAWQGHACGVVTSLALVVACGGEPDVVARGADGGPSDAGRVPPTDAGGIDPCDLDSLLERAGIPPEGIIVAATCQLPISWLSGGDPVTVGSQDLRELLMNSGPITPTPDTLTGQLLCSDEFAGLWYYDNPFRPTTIELCPDLCEFVRGAVAVRIEDLGCDSGLRPDGGELTGQFPFPFPFPTRPRPDAGDPDDAGT